jgi:hypothetical protein
MNAMKFHGELEFTLEATAKKCARSSRMKGKVPVTQPPYVRALIDYVVKRAVKIRSAFEALDRLRRAGVSIKIFATLISSFSGVRVLPADLDIITNFYSQNGIADYAAFLKDVQEASNAVQALVPSQKPTTEIDLTTIRKTLCALFTERRIAPHSSVEEVKALSNEFSAGSNEVNSDDFDASFIRQRPDPEDISHVLSTIRNGLTEHKLQLRPELVKLVRNFGDDVSRTQLIVAFQNSSIVLGTPQILGVVQEFPGSASSTVSISALCDTVDPLLLASTQISPPLSPVSSPRSPLFSPRRQGATHFGRSPANLGVDLEQEFRRLDRLRRRQVAEAQFAAVIGLLSPRISDKELRAVYAQYLVNGGFDYLSFCRDAALRPLAPCPEEAEELFAVMRKCKALMSSKLVRIDFVLKSYHPTGSGCVPV